MTVCGARNTSEDKSLACSPETSLGVAGQLRYVRIFDGSRWYVIAEVDLDGNETFSACEGDCGCWYPFTPTPAERKAVQGLRAEGKGKHGWTACIDLDAQVEDLTLESVAAFEQLIRGHVVRVVERQFDRNSLLAGEVNFHVEKGRSLIKGFAQWLRCSEMLVEALDRHERGNGLPSAGGA